MENSYRQKAMLAQRYEPFMKGNAQRYLDMRRRRKALHQRDYDFGHAYEFNLAIPGQFFDVANSMWSRWDLEEILNRRQTERPSTSGASRRH